MPVQIPPHPLSLAEQEQLQTYFELLKRWRMLPASQALPWLATRLLVLRYGFVQSLTAVARFGEDVVADRAMDQLQDATRLWWRQISVDPPAPDKYDAVMAAVYTLWTETRSPEVRAKVFTIVGRLRLREQVLQESRKPKLEKRG